MVDNKFCVLVVDDEDDTREMLDRGLRRRGYQVKVAADGKEAIKQLKASNIEIILLDIRLPDCEGIDLLENIKKINPDTEVIIITGYSSVESAILSMKRGAYDYLEKPLKIDKVAALIEKALEKHKLLETVALYEISTAIFSTIKMKELLQIIVDLTMKVLRADDTSVMLLDEQGKLYIAISYGLTEDIIKKTRIAIGERISGWVAQNTEPVILTGDLKDDPRFQELSVRGDIKSAIVVPLVKNKKVLGILNANRIKIEKGFNKGDLYKASIFASLVSLALDNANLYKELAILKDHMLLANEGLKKEESKCRDMIRELELSQKQLMQSSKLAALGRLVSDMAHEVNNPLMVISGTAQLALMEGVQDETMKSNFQIIRNECVRAKDIIERLLQFSRPSKGEFKKKDINDSIRVIVSLISHQFEINGIAIEEHYTKEPLWVCIDDKQIQEIILNIMNNAKDAMKDSGIIKIIISQEQDKARINIEDNGFGMPQEVLNKIFEPFFTTKEKGTGIGLSICQNIIKNHNGELNYASIVGKGTTASIKLPLAKEQ